MIPTPIDRSLIDNAIRDFGIQDFAKATIREVKAIAAFAEKESGVEFIKMEMGIPGLPAAQVGVDAQIDALKGGIARIYPDIQGNPELKKQASRFVKAFINVDIDPEGCIPVCGSMQGTFASFVTCSQADKKKNTVLFIDPGFPVQKMQLQVSRQRRKTARKTGVVPRKRQYLCHRLQQSQQSGLDMPQRGGTGYHRRNGQ